MIKVLHDTIVAIATPVGRGSVGIVRVSGALCEKIAFELLHQSIEPRFAHYGAFYDENDDAIDQGIALFFQSPNSFTGEDVLELQAHGGPVILDLLLNRILNLGARLSEPGEFSKRAFLNNKMDLMQAESIADLINATSERAVRSAVHVLQGEFSEFIHNLVDQLIQLRVYVEASIDFAEEDIELLKQGDVFARLDLILKTLNDLLEKATQGALLRDGMSIAMVGKPNAGKSSLLNVLSGQDAAIVTDIPGTTRDVLRESIHIDGMPLHIIDTAGLRESKDVIEQEGVRRTLKEIEKADQILWIVDSVVDETMDKLFDSVPNQLRDVLRERAQDITIVKNKIDLIDEGARVERLRDFTVIALSAKTYAGIDLLKNHLKTIAGFQPESEGLLMARRRHLDALNRAREFLLNGQRAFTVHQSTDLFAEDLRQAQLALCAITGEVTTEDLLDKIFSQFCVGK